MLTTFKLNKQLAPWHVNLIFMFLFILCPNDKAVFIVAFFHFVAMLIFTRSVVVTIVYIFWPWLVFEAGREFSTALVPIEFIRSNNYQSSVLASFIVSPWIFLSVISVAAAAANVRKIFSSPARTLILILMLYLSARMVSALFTEHHAVYSMIYVFRDASVVAWTILASLHIRKHSGAFLRNMVLTFLGLLLADCLIGVVQFIKGGSLGLAVERAHYLAAFGDGSDETAGLVRVSGLWQHPNVLSYWLTQVFFSIQFFLFGQQKKLKKITQCIVPFLAFVGLLTLSRIVFAVTGLAYIMFFSETNQLVKTIYSKINSLTAARKLVILLIFLILGFVSVNRLYARATSALHVLSENGGIATRSDQFVEAMRLFQIKPLFGHGPAMYTAALLRWIPDGEVQFFPEKVHNAFLLVAAESGILSIALLLLFMTKFVIQIRKSKFRKLGILWYISVVLFMLLQPFDFAPLSIGTASMLVLLQYVW